MSGDCDACGHEMGTTAPFTGFAPCPCKCHQTIKEKYGSPIGNE